MKLVEIVNELRTQDDLLTNWSVPGEKSSNLSTNLIDNGNQDRRTKMERIQDKKKSCQKLANRVAYISEREPMEIHNEWIKRAGKRPSIESDYDAKLNWLNELLNNTRNHNER